MDSLYEPEILLYEAEPIVRFLCEYLRSKCPHIRRIEAVGDFRRLCETVDQLEFLVECVKPDRLLKAIVNCPVVDQILPSGPDSIEVQLIDSEAVQTGFHFRESSLRSPAFYGMSVFFKIVPHLSFGPMMWEQTGSQKHLDDIRAKLERPIPTTGFNDEMEFFESLGLPWIPPELRNGRMEVDWALNNSLPKLVEITDLKGDLHSHTNWTDGNASIENMVQAAKQKGLSYLAITDHSKRVSQCNGLDEKRILEQWTLIDKLRDTLDDPNFFVLKGIEVDILEQGGLDLPDRILEQADWVVASLHFDQEQSRNRLTKRLLGAIENPNVCVIGHPTGRILPSYPPFDADWEAVFSAAAKNGCFLELNSHPRRLDLSDEFCIKAKDSGVKIVISSDAHSTAALALTRYGVNQARRGTLTAADVVNTLDWQQLKALLRNKHFNL